MPIIITRIGAIDAAYSGRYAVNAGGSATSNTTIAASRPSARTPSGSSTNRRSDSTVCVSPYRVWNRGYITSDSVLGT